MLIICTFFHQLYLIQNSGILIVLNHICHVCVCVCVCVWNKEVKGFQVIELVLSDSVLSYF